MLRRDGHMDQSWIGRINWLLGDNGWLGEFKITTTGLLEGMELAFWRALCCLQKNIDYGTL